MAGGYSGWQHTGGLNWDGVSVEGPKPPAPGACELKVLSMEPQESSTGSPMIKCKFELVSHSSDEESVGRKVYDNFVLTNEGAFKVKNYLLVMELDPKEALPDVGYDTVKAFCESQENSFVSAMISHKKGQNGKPQANIEYYGAEPPTNSANGNGSAREAHPARPAAKGKGGKAQARR